MTKSCLSVASLALPPATAINYLIERGLSGACMTTRRYRLYLRLSNARVRARCAAVSDRVSSLYCEFKVAQVSQGDVEGFQPDLDLWQYQHVIGAVKE